MSEPSESDVNLGEEVYKAMLADILAARLPGGRPVQQRRLAEQYKVSRSPMRHAISRLEGEGLLIRDGSVGLVIRTVTLKDYLDSLSMRELLEPEAAARAAENAETEMLQAIAAECDRLAGDTAPDPEAVWAFDNALHGYVAARSGNPFMAAVINDMRRYTTIFERQLPVVRAKPGMHEHEEILGALRRGDGEAARQAMSRHLVVVREGVLQNY
ncbi:GntR family transcriptional regulator [Martelella sp. HB161492]|uniref:GntR family transcriptional regulator n=1 Tax=Martelella sp. HB161492 TaxID=2720726 RepID=UPI00158FBE6C|nr:GntR family transcriptional regulator [Martelella sp. HB161492]